MQPIGPCHHYGALGCHMQEDKRQMHKPSLGDLIVVTFESCLIDRGSYTICISDLKFLWGTHGKYILYRRRFLWY